ncbi:neuroglobin [Plakobranchus ocellatus]|uniref:Neuroglobin n=1 Tax=Plakobranchus ocellatus TaxID=259542 RepID=A0AAV4C7V1_9GAST|nr:neuroglobin [Plakobranchus ocellatus]
MGQGKKWGGWVKEEQIFSLVVGPADLTCLERVRTAGLVFVKLKTKQGSVMAESANNITAPGGGGGAVQPPSPPAPDPRLPLTPMQVFKLKKNWKGVKRRLEDTGVEMLIR